MLCHPHNPRAGTALDGFYLGNVIGNPLETTIAFCRLVLGGVLDEAPDLRLCFSHGGGYIAAAIGRLDHAYAVRPETTGSRRRPSDYLRSVYFDSLTHDPRGLADLVDRVGADRVLVGSDYPADMGAKRPTEVVRLAGLAPEDEHSVLQGNAARLFPGIVSSDSATVH
jgi:aminocarboxymuconate-semialdehyde decarboxylase